MLSYLKVKLMREELHESDMSMPVILKMAEGNPGATWVLLELLKKPYGALLIYGLDEMNMRGAQIWIGFKDFCHENIDQYADIIRHRDKPFVDYVNQVAAKSGIIEKAVTSGGKSQAEPVLPRRVIR
jgi:hypothetical protein